MTQAVKPEPATTRLDDLLTDTEVGSVFVSNYPPYSFWKTGDVPAAHAALDAPVETETAVDLGLYIHIPFCRKRCKFCYFRVYVDKNASQIQEYLDGLSREIELYSQRPRIDSRPLKFVYFGGGTPSYISARHLKAFVKQATAALPWSEAEEIAFECEPGTLTEAKVEAIADIGVTRLSLGVENLNDAILAENGRAHLSREVYEVMPWIEARQFEQVNVDLIAGMTGETWESWRETVARTIDLGADSITVYQMELPYNTVFSKAISDGKRKELILADWQTKRQWHAYAFEQFAAVGYGQSSAYTMVRVREETGSNRSFVYRDALWRGSDMIGAGVASFSHMGGVHYQNVSSWEGYLGELEKGRLPIERALQITPAEQLTRQFILQLKLGCVNVKGDDFARFGVNVIGRFGPALESLQGEGMLTFGPDEVRLTPKGLLRVDQLLPLFYDENYRNSRYT